MKIINTIKSFLDGKKTYLAGIAMVISGYVNNDWQMVLNGLSIIFLRQAITKVNY